MTDRLNERWTDQRVWLVAVALLMGFLNSCGEKEPVRPLVDTPNMAFVPSGWFTMGTPEDEGAPDAPSTRRTLRIRCGLAGDALAG